MVDIEYGRLGSEHESCDPYSKHGFAKEVDNAKENVEQMEKLYKGLLESNEEMKAASSAKTMMELRTRTNLDLDHVVKLAMQINRKFYGLVRTNAAQRRLSGKGRGSADDRHMISGLGKSLKDIMVRFQGLRVRMETDHRHAIEDRYLSITGEKATEEAIDNLVSNTDIESLLHQATQEQGKGTVLDSVAEIQERRDTMRENRRNLTKLHQILLGMAQGQCGATKPVKFHLAAPLVAKMGVTRLNDYEKKIRNQAYIALTIALMASMLIVVLYLKYESKDQEYWTDDQTPKRGILLL